MESEDCECELVRACGALHCQRCWSLFSAVEDAPHAPQVLPCGHCLCRACVTADMARLWDPRAAAPNTNAATQPPCTCAVCSASYAPSGAQPVLPFFCAALAQVVSELRVLARAPATATTTTSTTENAAPSAPPQPQPSTTTTATTEATLPVPTVPSNVSEEQEKKQAVPAEVSAEVAQAQPETQPQVPQPQVPQPQVPQPQVPQPQVPQPEAQLPLEPSQQQFTYYAFRVARADVRACVVHWLETHAGSMLGLLAPSRETVQTQTDRAVASLVPAFVPFHHLYAPGSSSPTSTSHGRIRAHRAAVPQCVWDSAPAEGREAAGAAVRRVAWDAQQAHTCSPDERPRPGLWLPPSAETAPRAVPRLPVVPAVAERGAGAETLVHVPFWVAAVDVQAWRTLLVCALDGTAVGVRAALLPQVQAARAAHNSSSSSGSSGADA